MAREGFWRRYVRNVWPESRQIAKPLAYRSYAELGEDKALVDMLANARGRKYVDLGCNNPHHGSATYLLYKCGWSGWVIDAESRHRSAFQRIRPRDTFIEAVLDDRSRTVQMVVADEETSIDPVRVEGAVDARTRTAHTKDAGEFLKRIIGAPEDVDLLKVDLEGMDRRVVMRIDLDWLAPQVVMVETNISSLTALSKDPLAIYMQRHGYLPVYQNRRNTIFARN